MVPQQTPFDTDIAYMTTSKNHQLLRFWAKTSHDPEKLPNAFHPLICHLIDVACVAEAMWNDVLPTVTKRRLAKPFGLDCDAPDCSHNNCSLALAGKLIAFISGLHDLGKCSPPFQLRGKNEFPGGQTRRIFDSFSDTDLFSNEFARSSDAPHGFVTVCELPAILNEHYGLPLKFAKNLSEIIGGHHGIFAHSRELRELKQNFATHLGGEEWKNARLVITAKLAELFGVDQLAVNVDDQALDNATAMIFAGFTTAADWIGSNTDFFPSKVADSTLPYDFEIVEYVSDARANAADALHELGWTRWPKEQASRTFGELFPFIGDNLRDLQAKGVELANKITSPGIVIAEAPMGEGKTELAMYLADAFNAKFGTRGIYFALPTQATSNQMFGRISQFLHSRFGSDDVNISLMLQHGHASIAEEFEEQIKNFQTLKNLYDDGMSAADAGCSNISAAEWFTYRKRGLLAPYGVGTIDQLLLAALQTKHVFVRLFGVANKTIIIDEVHAYDAYMSTLLCRLLEWLAALGSPVIILSATLPKSRRDALIKAYLKGIKKAGKNAVVQTSDADSYPRISYADASMPVETFGVIPVKTSPQNEKTLYLEWHKYDDLATDLKTKLKKGGCAAVICNTVGKAQAVYEELRKDPFFQGNADDDLPKLDLLHSRFRFRDRDERERRALRRFGKLAPKQPENNNGTNDKAKVRRPHMAVLVATQIIEQSLDLDFDLMVSDLAPVDLLLQRSGRLQRHKRDERLAEFCDTDGSERPVMWLLEPELDENRDLLRQKNGLPDLGVSGLIYDKHILLRTWLNLRNASQIAVPGEIERLIEAVYADHAETANLTETEAEMWHATQRAHIDAVDLDEAQAKVNYINHPYFEDLLGNLLGTPKEEDNPELHRSMQAQTRLVEPTANVVCLWERDGRIFIDEEFKDEISLDQTPHKRIVKKLLFNSLAVSNRSVVYQLFDEPVPSGWQSSVLLRRHRALIFNADRECEMFGRIFRLDQGQGLLITKKEEI